MKKYLIRNYIFLAKLIKVGTLRQLLPPNLTSIKNLQNKFAKNIDPSTPNLLGPSDLLGNGE